MNFTKLRLHLAAGCLTCDFVTNENARDRDFCGRGLLFYLCLHGNDDVLLLHRFLERGASLELDASRPCTRRRFLASLG